MTKTTLSEFDHEGKTPSQLEERRREILAKIREYPLGYDDPDIPTDILRELATVVSTLRRRNAGPPKAKRAPAAKPTVDDLEGLL